ncbi:SDR family NAD(P)-dependent oxidoreductase [Jiangella asiatica]|uniref:SDR family oxidoreductase n=1 Tax=Jiangella asiatica TaxID=2530372 RepID=A0A4R5DBB7_9ACTN|nr:SDR family oxidoreductase [Jiangella asiatica]TDE10949.1 SDR family oxidoreductase [Jiangella asiatica]
MARFDGEAVVVVGAGGGIGAAVVSAFAAGGAAVVLVDQRSDVAARAADLGGTSAAVVGDGSDPEVLERAVDSAAGAGRLTTLVYAVAYQRPASVLDLTSQEWDRAHDVAVKGAWLAAGRFASAVRQQRGGPASIVMIASIHAYQAYPRDAAYGTAKAALVGLTRSLAVELGPLGIRCNAVAPGFIAVERNREAWRRPEQAARHAARNPLRRLGRPEDVAGVVTFLASDDAAHVNGVCLLVDGGELAAGPGDFDRDHDVLTEDQ